MTLGIDFGKDGKVYGLLYAMGYTTNLTWEMAFYSSEGQRKRAIKHLRTFKNELRPILKFELTLPEIRLRSIPVPFISYDKSGELDNVVNPQWNKKYQRPVWKDN